MVQCNSLSSLQNLRNLERARENEIKMQKKEREAMLGMMSPKQRAMVSDKAVYW